MEDIKLVSAFIGAFSAISVMMINNWLQKRQKRKEFLIGKLEELYELFLEFARQNQEKYDNVFDHIHDDKYSIETLTKQQGARIGRTIIPIMGYLAIPNSSHYSVQLQKYPKSLF